MDRENSNHQSVNTSGGSTPRSVPSNQPQQPNTHSYVPPRSNQASSSGRPYSPNLGLGAFSTFRPNENLNDSQGSNYSSNFARDLSPRQTTSNASTHFNIPLEVDYIEEEDLDLLNLDNYEIYTDEKSNESYIVNLSEPSQRMILLPESWRTGTSQYLSEEDVEASNLEIYIEPISKRKYILDEANDKKYYLVSEKSLSKRKKNLGYNKQSKLRTLLDDDELIDDSSDVIHYSHNENPAHDDSYNLDSSMTNNDFLGFIDEDELKSIDLTKAIFYEDELTNEIYLQNQNDPDKHWIVLPKDWQVSETSPYLTEEDVQVLTCEMYIDPRTKRKYVIDEKSGKRYYVINENDIDNASLKKEWNKRVNKPVNPHLNQSRLNSDDKSPNNKQIKITLDETLKSIQASSGETF